MDDDNDGFDTDEGVLTVLPPLPSVLLMLLLPLLLLFIDFLLVDAGLDFVLDPIIGGNIDPSLRTTAPIIINLSFRRCNNSDVLTLILRFIQNIICNGSSAVSYGK